MSNYSLLDISWPIQEAMHSAETLSVIVDSTFRSIDDMHKWTYKTKDEMKHLGGTLMAVTDKTGELIELGCAKMVEDAFNNSNEITESNSQIWDDAMGNLLFAREVRRTRHITNLIKHNNSVILRSSGSRSARVLIDEYGFQDDQPLRYAYRRDQTTPKDYLLTSIFYAFHFSFDLFRHESLLPRNMHSDNIEDIPSYMLNRFVHNLPDDPSTRKGS